MGEGQGGEFFEALVHAAPVGVLAVRPGGEIAFANRQCETMLGWQPGTLAGQGLAAVLDLPLSALADAFDPERRTPEMASGIPLTARRRDGTALMVDVSLSRIDAPRQPLLEPLLMAAVQDATNRWRVERELEASELRFRTTVDDLAISLSIFSAIRDAGGRIVDFRWEYANRAGSAVTGYPAERLVGRSLLDVLPDHGPSGVFGLYRRVVESGEPYLNPDCSYEGTWGDGVPQRRAFEVRATKLGDGFVVVARDITALREQEAAVERQRGELERSYAEIRLLNELAEFLQGCLTEAEAYPIAARCAGRLFPGLSGAISLTLPSRELVESAATWGDVGPGQAVFAPSECWALRLGRHHISGPGEPRCAHLAGSPAAWSLCVPMIGQAESIGVFHVLRAGGGGAGDAPSAGEEAFPEAVVQLALTVAGQVSMATANLKLRDTLRSWSIRDPLTGLYNRRFMEETLNRELHVGVRTGAPVAVLQVDIDHFKAYNDTYGHEAGDVVMRAVAEAMLDQFRVSDVACRYGGEEFTVILPGCALAVAASRADELRRRIARLHIAHDRSPLPTPTVSCGVAAFPEHGTTPQALVRAADDALYAAKAAGRDRVVTAATGGTVLPDRS